MNILKMHGTDICSLGLAEVPSNDPAYEEVVFIDKAKRYYKKCIIHNDRLVGALLTQLVKANPQYSAVSISAGPNNPVVRLYDRFGFKIVQQSENAVTLRREI